MSTPRRILRLGAWLACCLGSLDWSHADEIETFSLIDADTDQRLAAYDPLLDGATIDLATLPLRTSTSAPTPRPRRSGASALP